MNPDWQLALDALRPVTLPQEHPLRARDHAALVYWTSAELFEMAVPYLVEGLKAGDKVVYIAHDHPSDGIEAALWHAAVPVAAEKAAGRLAVLSAKDAFYPNGRFDPDEALAGLAALAEEARRDGFGRMRLAVEMTYLLADVPGIERGAEFEARVNAELFSEHPFSCLRAFNGNLGVGGALAEVLRSHPVLLSRGLPLLNPWYEPGLQKRAG